MKALVLTTTMFLGVFYLTACGHEPTTEEKLEAERQQILVQGANKALAEYDRKEKLFAQPLTRDPPAGLAACKASIGELMSEPPAIMSGKTRGKGRYEVTYSRPSDGERWTYRCRVSPRELMWATLEKGSQGPWRGAEEIRYRLSGTHLILTLRDLNGADYEVAYSYPKLKKLS